LPKEVEMRFPDRRHAGSQLAEALQKAGIGPDVVLGLPRGGVPVAFEVSASLGIPMDVIVVRKLGAPFQPELAMGALGEGGVRVENREVLRLVGLDEPTFDLVVDRESEELERRAALYRGNRPRLDLEARRVVIVDDGIATGSTARAAARVARVQGASHVVVAAPVASSLGLASLADVTDEVVCVTVPEPFYAVGEWYLDFSQTSDSDVRDLLARADARRMPGFAEDP
jgi:putative phosphoribosyl transferase